MHVVCASVSGFALVNMCLDSPHLEMLKIWLSTLVSLFGCSLQACAGVMEVLTFLLEHDQTKSFRIRLEYHNFSHWNKERWVPDEPELAGNILMH